MTKITVLDQPPGVRRYNQVCFTASTKYLLSFVEHKIKLPGIK